MKCDMIMKTNHPTLLDTESVSKALDLLLTHTVLTVPVVNASGRYLGMFGKHRILSLLLPKAATLNEGRSSLPDLSFMGDTIDDVRKHLAAIANDPVSKYIETDAPLVKVDTPLMEALLLIYRARNYLPVVDGAGKLVGVLSSWDALAKIVGKE